MVSFSTITTDRPALLCSQCGLPMTRAAPVPIMFTDSLSNVAYHCEACKADIVRTEKRDGSPHKVGAVNE